MRLNLTDADRTLQDQFRHFLRDNLPASLADKVRLGRSVSKPELRDWTRLLSAQGWSAPNWPVRHGGPGWSMVQRHLFDLECRLAHAPPLQGFGFNMVGPAIIRYGTERQQREYLPRILAADHWWCQGYSEPGAGSDLASLDTRAVSEGDHYVVTGSKLWTSGAEEADHIFCLVRTDAKAVPQRGISFLLIDLASEGIRIEPLMAFNGRRLWNQVFFDQVRVPRENCLGGENAGWEVAKNLLGNERLMVSRVAENRRLLANVREALTLARDGAEIEPELLKRVSELDIRLRALDATALRLLLAVDAGRTVGAEPSMLKLKGSELVQDMDRTLLELSGWLALPLDSQLRGAEPIGAAHQDMVASQLFHHRGYTIAGGTSEVQHNIIAKAVLGL